MNSPHYIIHSAATAAGAAGAGMAQIPGSDSVIITPIQIAMIMSLAHYHGIDLSRASAATTLSSVSATVTGRTVSQLIIGWIPGYGNAVNATTAAAITEAIGWAANASFEMR